MAPVVLLLAVSFTASFFATLAFRVRGAIVVFFAGPVLLLATRGGVGSPASLLVDLALPTQYWLLASYPGAAAALFLRGEAANRGSGPHGGGAGEARRLGRGYRLKGVEDGLE